MLTSLIALYIATNLNYTTPALNQYPQSSSIVKTASANFSSILESAPIKNPKYINPIIQAKGGISMDLESGEILFEDNIHKRMPIASITKLMTVLIVMEENQLSDIVTVSNNAANTEGSAMDLRNGEQITVENLIYGTIIHSANDAAVALAEHNSETVTKFVAKMNKKTQELGLLNTHFSNPIGLDELDNYSSPYDIAKIGQIVYKNPFIQKASLVKNLEVYSLSSIYKHKLETTNDLLNSEYFKIKGLKTGHTTSAGLCLISVAENEAGNQIITVVLNSPARFTETKILVDWSFRAYNWI